MKKPTRTESKPAAPLKPLPLHQLANVVGGMDFIGQKSGHIDGP